MKKSRSYTDLMKSTVKNRLQVNERVNIYVEMIVDEILFNSKVKKLEAEINLALDTRNRSSFIKLSKEYQQLMKHA